MQSICRLYLHALMLVLTGCPIDGQLRTVSTVKATRTSPRPRAIPARDLLISRRWLAVTLRPAVRVEIIRMPTLVLETSGWAHRRGTAANDDPTAALAVAPLSISTPCYGRVRLIPAGYRRSADLKRTRPLLVGGGCLLDPSNRGPDDAGADRGCRGAGNRLKKIA
jgi:hypothetical protein